VRYFRAEPQGRHYVLPSFRVSNLLAGRT
jgi:hypothetical protein